LNAGWYGLRSALPTNGAIGWISSSPLADDVYGHSLPEMHEEAMDKLDLAFGDEMDNGKALQDSYIWQSRVCLAPPTFISSSCPANFLRFRISNPLLHQIMDAVGNEWIRSCSQKKWRK
jgi:hypothetical protein